MKRMKYIYMSLAVPLLLWSCRSGSCNGGGNGTIPPPPPQEEVYDAYVYTTTADGSRLFSVEGQSFGKHASMSPYRVTLEPDTRFQTVDGFGAAMTWATCHNLLKMTQEDRTAMLREFFDPDEGLGISLIRVSIGASDFNLDEYTWCDTPGIDNFAMHPSDRDVVIPVLKEMYAINPDVKIIASPWSCPRWMKRRSVTDNRDFNSWTSGSLKPSCYQDYAEYFVRWIRAMEAEGFDILAVTVQNEPLNHGNSMSLYMTWEEQRDFIKTALGPAFENAGVKAKILVFDHNYNYDEIASQKDYPLNIYADPDASRYIAGSAWHDYRGNPAELSHIAASAPDKEIYFTESSIGTWNYNFGSCLIVDFNSIFIQTLARECKGVTLWNMVLDEKLGPFSPQPGSCKTCFGVVTMESTTAKIIERNSHYYNIAHASKVIKPGAVRIGTGGFTAPQLEYQAYLNPDGSYGVIVLNAGSQARQLVFVDEAHSVRCEAPAKSIVSLSWKD